MAEEPSNGELWRSLSDIKSLVQSLVGNREYVEFQRHVTHVLGELAAAIAAERDARDKAIEVERTARVKGFEAIATEQAAGRRTTKGAFMASAGTVIGGIILAAFVAWVTMGGHR